MFGKLKNLFNSSEKLTAEEEGDIPFGNYILYRGDLDKVHRVTSEGDADKLYSHLIKNRSDVNRRDRRHRTPLHIACAAGNEDAVKLLAALNAEINVSDGSGNSALMKAVQGGHGNCVEILLEKRANINMRDANGDTALHQATSLSNRSIVTLLLDNGAYIDAQNKNGHTPLATAILTNNIEMAKYLIVKGADNNVTDAKKRTPIMLAIQNHQSDIVKLLKFCKTQNSEESLIEPPVMKSKPKNQVQERKSDWRHSKTPKMEETAQSKRKGANEKTKYLGRLRLIESYNLSDSDWDSSETSEASKKTAPMMVSKPKHQVQDKGSDHVHFKNAWMEKSALSTYNETNEKPNVTQKPQSTDENSLSDLSDWDSSETSESKKTAPMMVSKPKNQVQEKRSDYVHFNNPWMKKSALSEHSGANEKQNVTANPQLMDENSLSDLSDWDSSETSEASKNPAPMVVSKPKDQVQEKGSDYVHFKNPEMKKSALSEHNRANEEQNVIRKPQLMDKDNFSDLSDWDSSDTSEASKNLAPMVVSKLKNQVHEKGSDDMQSKNPEMKEPTQSENKGASEMKKHTGKLIDAYNFSDSDWDSSELSEASKKAAPVKDKMSAQLADTPKCSNNNVTLNPTETPCSAKMSGSHDSDQVKDKQERIQVENSQQERIANVEHSLQLENEVSKLQFQLTEELKHKQVLATQVEELLSSLMSHEKLVSEHEATKKCLSLAQSECQLLRDQLQATKTCDCEKRVQRVKERNNNLLREATDLKDQIIRLKEETNNRGASLQQELSDTQNNLAKSEASLDEKNVYCKSLEQENVSRLRKMDLLQKKLAEVENQSVFLRNCVDEKEKACVIATQRLKEEESTSAASSATIKNLEEVVQKLKLEMIPQETTVKRQSYKIEVLEKQAQESVVIKQDLEELVSNLQSKQNQSNLSPTGQRYQALWEQEVENTSRLGQQVLELEKKKSEQVSLTERVKAKANKILEQKKVGDSCLKQEITKNTELQEEICRLRTQVKTANPKTHEKHMRVEGINMHTSVVDRDTLKCQQLEVDISDLRKEQMSLNILLEQSERSAVELRALMEVTQRGRKYDEVTDRQKLQTKLDQVNSILRTEHASREAKQFWMEQRISELEKEVVRRQSSEQECLSRLNFTCTELEKYKIKYSKERHKRLWL